MKQFTYTNYAPRASVDKNGIRRKHTNAIRIWKENGHIAYDRRYICSDGKVSQTAIKSVLDSNDPILIARQIHWGCCGWAGNSHGLIEQVKMAIIELDNS